MTDYAKLRSRSSISGISSKTKGTFAHAYLFNELYSANLLIGTARSVEEDEIELQTSALREKLTSDTSGPGKESSARGLKPHQVHELAKAKIEESEKLRKALGIREDYEEGSHWKRQEERLRDGVPEKGTQRS